MSVLYNRDFGISSKIKLLHFAFKYRKVSGLFLEIELLKVSLAVPRTLLWSGLVTLPGSLHVRSCSSDLFPGIGRISLWSGSHRKDLVLPLYCESCWNNTAVVSSLQRHPFTELEQCLTREGLFQETSFLGGVDSAQKVLGEGVPSLLTQKDITETSQCPDFSTVCLPCRLWYLRDISRKSTLLLFAPQLTLKHSLERENVVSDVAHLC